MRDVPAVTDGAYGTLFRSEPNSRPVPGGGMSLLLVPATFWRRSAFLCGFYSESYTQLYMHLYNTIYFEEVLGSVSLRLQETKVVVIIIIIGKTALSEP
jgi:hypothetical protein